MKTAVLALAVFWHLVLFGECLNTNLLLVALLAKLRLDVVLGESKLKAATVCLVG